MIKRLRGQQDRLFALIDQAFVGGGNLLVMSLLAHSLPKADFGAIGSAVGVYYLLFGFHRANLVLPFVLSGKDDSEVPQSAWAWLAFWTSAGVAIAMVATSMTLDLYSWGPPFLRKVLAYSAIMTPLMLLQEFARRWLYQVGRNASAAGSSLASFVIMVGVAALIYKQRDLAGLAPWAFAAGALGAVVVALFRRPPLPVVPLAPFGRLWNRRRSFSLWQSLTHLPYTLYNQGFVLLLAATGGAAAAASFTALRTLLSPSASLISAVDSTDKLRAVAAFQKDGTLGIKRSTDRTRRFLLVLTLPFLLLVCGLAGPLQRIMFGPAYVHPVETWVLAAYYLLLAVNQPSETFLIIQERGRLLFLSRVLSGGTAVFGLVLLGPAYGLLGAVAALAIAQTVNNLALGWLVRRDLSRPTSP